MAKNKNIRKRIFDIIQIGNRGDLPSFSFDIFITVAILLNLAATIAQTFEECEGIMPLLNVIETVTVIIFTIEYILRIVTADYLYPKRSPVWARISFLFSFFGLVDLFTILPFFLPFFMEI